MTVLATLYASGSTTEIALETLEIRRPSAASVYICAGYEDVAARLETGELVTFIGRAIDIALPPADASGNQSLTFAIDNVTGEAQDYIDSALSAGEQMLLVRRIYLMSYLDAPADLPLEMPIISGGFQGPTLQVQAMLNDLLNTAWPRTRYTASFAPGLRYVA